MAIRIIGGACRGFMINGPKGDQTRPILARVRKSFFDIIAPIIKEAEVLDLFSGSGVVGIEAGSRGAKRSILVEKDRKVCDCIKKNVKHCKLDEICEINCTDVFPFISFSKDKFDIIFAGPPYPMLLGNKVLEALSESTLLKDTTSVIIQHDKREKLEEKVGSLVHFRQEKYGDTLLSFYKKKV